MGAQWNFYNALNPDGEYRYVHSSNAPEIPGVALNFSRMSSPVIDAPMDDTRGTDDVERLRELYGDFQQELNDISAHVFLFHNQGAVVATPAVRDLNAWTMPDGRPGLGQYQMRHRLHQVWLDQ